MKKFNARAEYVIFNIIREEILPNVDSIITSMARGNDFIPQIICDLLNAKYDYTKHSSLSRMSKTDFIMAVEKTLMMGSGYKIKPTTKLPLIKYNQEELTNVIKFFIINVERISPRRIQNNTKLSKDYDRVILKSRINRILYKYNLPRRVAALALSLVVVMTIRTLILKTNASLEDEQIISSTSIETMAPVSTTELEFEEPTISDRELELVTEAVIDEITNNSFLETKMDAIRQRSTMQSEVRYPKAEVEPESVVITLEDKNVKILDYFGISVEELAKIHAIVIAEGVPLEFGEPRVYNEQRNVINTLYNRSNSKSWVAFADIFPSMQGRGTNIFVQATIPEQFVVYQEGLYLDYLGQESPAVTDYLYSIAMGEIVEDHGYLSFKAASTPVAGGIQLVENGNWHHAPFEEGDKIVVEDRALVLESN